MGIQQLKYLHIVSHKMKENTREILGEIKMRQINQLNYPDMQYPTTLEAGAQLCPPYPSVAKAGCGLCCACMLVEKMTGCQLALEECVRWSVEIGANTNGTNMVRLGEAIAERYGLQLAMGNDVDAVLRALQAGGCAVVNVGRTEGLFSDQGHFVLAFQYQNGLIWIADPSYTREKYEKECRRDKVRLEGTCVLVTPEALQREAASRKPGFYIFETRKDRSSMKKVHTDLAPKAIGPYSQAMICGGMVYTSGQIPLDPVSGSVSGEEIQSQSRQVLENLKAVLEAAGSGMDKVVKTTCFLADMQDFAAFNQIYAEYFPHCPSRSCFAVKELPKQVLVEVEAVAALTDD